MAKSEAPKTRNNPKRAQTRAAIVRAASQLAGEVSYEAMSLEMVAQAAGVSRRTIYGHFRSKSDLFIAVSDDRWAIAVPRRKSATTLEEHVRGMGPALVAATQVRARRAIHAAGMQIHMMTHDDLRQQTLALVRRVLGEFETALTEDFPGVPLAIPPEQFVRVFDALLEGLAHRRALLPEEFTDDVILAAVELLARVARP